MAKKATKNLKKAAHDLESAAQHYKKAAKQEKKGHLAKAARHADASQVKTHVAERYASEASRDNAEDLRDKQAEADGDDII
jgi:hypothetical protein